MNASGSMMRYPLLIANILRHAEAQFGAQEVVSRETHGPLFRQSFTGLARRARLWARGLAGLGLRAGDTVASIAWNNRRHLESYYAVSGSGMVMHTCNPRLHPDQLAWIINHARDRVVLFDASFAPLVASLAPRCPLVEAWVCLAARSDMPDLDLPVPLLCHEELVDAASAEFVWPDLDEQSGAVLCYTSGTTGHPKGVLYSHRAIVLNALSACLPDVLNLGVGETVLPVVPMFHINAWCIPYAALIAGARLVLPGPRLDAPALHALMEAEGVTMSAGVPTIWMNLVQHLDAQGARFSTLRRGCVGGSAMPPALIARLADHYGVEMRHGWGMTETTAVATMSNLSRAERARPAAERHAIVGRQGRSVFGVELKIVDDQGRTLPRDGTSQGELLVRGSWIVDTYHRAEASALRAGWFPTGDIATIDADGIMQIRDRTKDVIKSGGEWISSIELENVASAHPDVAMAAVIGVQHPTWGERPLLLIVPRPGTRPDPDAVRAFIATRVVKWWVPERVLVVEALPVGGTGKVQKNELRRQHAGIFSD